MTRSLFDTASGRVDSFHTFISMSTSKRSCTWWHVQACAVRIMRVENLGGAALHPYQAGSLVVTGCVGDT